MVWSKTPIVDAFLLILLTVPLLAQDGSHTAHAAPSQVYDELQKVAKDFSQGDAYPQRITVTTKSLSVDLDTIPYKFLISEPDRFTPALELLVRVQQVRRELGEQLPKERFWEDPVRQIEKIPLKLIDAAVQAESDDSWMDRQKQFDDEARIHFDQLREALKDYAKRNGLSFDESRGPLAGYFIEVKIPFHVKVRYMTLGDYNHCERLHFDLERHWMDLEPHAWLIGRYQYVADKDITGSPKRHLEGTFMVRSSSDSVVIPEP